MKKRITAILCAVLFSVSMFVGFAKPVEAKETYKIGTSIYVGWAPYLYGKFSGIFKKWGDKYNVNIEIDLITDYIESINLYTAGKYVGCTMTEMDALTIPAVGGVDSTVLIVGDFSNGNDGIVSLEAQSVKELKGKTVSMVELSVTDYMTVRALGMNGMTRRDINVVNVSDSEIAALFKSGQAKTVGTWNPPLMEVRNTTGAKLIFDSSQIPGEIIDVLVVRTDTPDAVKKALVGAWYEIMQIMSGRGKVKNEAIEYMAKSNGGTVAEFKAQLRTTAMFYTPSSALGFINSSKLKETMEHVRTFSFDNGLFGENASTKDFVGIEFPDGSKMGDKNNVKLRFDSKYTALAAQGEL